MHVDVAEPIGLCLFHAQSEVKARERRRMEVPSLEVVFEIAKLLTGATDPVAAMPSVFSMLSSFVGLQSGALALISEPGETRPEGRKINPFVIAATAQGAAPDMPPDAQVPQRVVSMVFRTGVPVVSLDVRTELGQDAMPVGGETDNLALVAVPIRAESDLPMVIGVLTIYRPFTDDPARDVDNDLRVVTMIASLLEQALRFRRLVARDRERMFREAGNALQALQEVGEERETVLPIDGIIGQSRALRAVTRRIRKVAKTSAQVLLRGESGTGKELFARAIHVLSDRADKPFVKVNCAALSETLLETELFGHEKGSFTGATGQKKGRFELADGGTLFLDEIGEIKPAFQTKLLRVLQEGEFERVGGSKTLSVDVRLVTATNRDLERAVAQGTFRADLYFRICVVPIELPPLRERPEDIPELAQTFLERFNEENGTELKMEEHALDTLARCAFPGNVRELENCINRTAALTEGEVIRESDIACHQNECLSAELWRMQSSKSPIGSLSAGQVVYGEARKPSPLPGFQARRPAAPTPSRSSASSERDELVEAMEQSGWVQAKAARLLGLTPRQVGYALRKHDIEIKKL